MSSGDDSGSPRHSARRSAEGRDRSGAATVRGRHLATASSDCRAGPSAAPAAGSRPPAATAGLNEAENRRRRRWEAGGLPASRSGLPTTGFTLKTRVKDPTTALLLPQPAQPHGCSASLQFACGAREVSTHLPTALDNPLNYYK